ncbi:hypothetical protein Cantr_00906 [Candida viswanathii]|uniref:Uncharacterized protein n=1 Tax=Candida viswanathii TaxID=5486 RepID=A0A367YH78_9ASCO|nr:hypothetical protein Cantr_00906 [Candida viswanathii]
MEEALKIAHACPAHLENINIEVFSQIHIWDSLTNIADEHQQNPFIINSLTTAMGPRIGEAIPFAVFRNLQTLDLGPHPLDELAIMNSANFPRLLSLRLFDTLEMHNIQALPRTLVSLCCRVESQSAEQDFLGLPVNLKKSKLWISESGERSRWPCDVSYLAGLKSLEFSSYLSHIKVPVPPSLRSLGAILHETIIGELPELVELNVNSSELHASQYLGALRELSLPASSLHCEAELLLELPVEARSRFQLPKGLRNLAIREGKKSGKETVLDFENNKCGNLQELHLKNVECSKVFGRFPRTLAKRSLVETPTFDFQVLTYLVNLSELDV